MAKQTIEQTAREYLATVKNIDIQELRERLEKATDPLDRVLLRSKIDKFNAIEEAFRKIARSFVERHGVTARALIDEGVPEDVVKDVGLNGQATTTTTTTKDTKKKATKKKAAKATAKKATAKKKARAKPTPADEVIKTVASWDGTFTIPDVIEATGASRATVRKALDHMLADNAVKESGKVDHSGPGRAATVYEPIKD